MFIRNNQDVNRIRVQLAYLALTMTVVVPVLGFAFGHLPQWNMFLKVVEICKVQSIEQQTAQGWSVLSRRDGYPEGHHRTPTRLVFPWTNASDVQRWYCAPGRMSVRATMNCAEERGWREKIVEAKCG